MRSDYLRVNRLNPTWETPWYAEAFQFREWCDEGYYEITDSGRLVKLLRPNPNHEPLALEMRIDTRYNGIIEFWGKIHRLPDVGYDIDTYQAQFLDGQLIAIWRKGAFGDIVTTQAEWEAAEEYKARRKAMTPEERAADDAAHAARMQAAVDLMVDQFYRDANRPGFMRRFLEKTK